MIEVKCPYSPLEIMTTMAVFPDYGDDVRDKAGAIIKAGLKNLNPPKVAESYGISPKELVDSPNFDKIMGSATGIAVREIVRDLVTELGMKDREAWAIMMAISNPEFMEKGNNDAHAGRDKEVGK